LNPSAAEQSGFGRQNRTLTHSAHHHRSIFARAPRLWLALLAVVGLVAQCFIASAGELFAYRDLDNNSGTFFPNGGAALVGANTITRLVADDLTPRPGFAGLAISTIYFSVVNANGAAVSARPRLPMCNAAA